MPSVVAQLEPTRRKTPSKKMTASAILVVIGLATLVGVCRTDRQNEVDTQSKCDQLCLSEECVMAAATVMSSLDRSADPCQDFYQFACGGWIQRAIVQNTDRFHMVDKRNQNIIAQILQRPLNESSSKAETKAKRYFQACVSTEDNQRGNLPYLQALVEYVGGWNISGSLNSSVTFDDRLRLIQNHLGLDVFFTWGVIDHHGENVIAVAAGGWNDNLVLEEGYRDEYLKLMSTYALFLSQASELEEQSDYDIGVDFNITNEEAGSDVNKTLDVTYDYVEEPMNASSSTLWSLLYWNNSSPEKNEEYLPNDAMKLTGGNSRDPVTYDYQSDEQQHKRLHFEDISTYLLARTTFIENEMSKVLVLEEALANISTKPIDSNTLRAISIGNLTLAYPFINWIGFFTDGFDRVARPENATRTLDEDTVILVQEEYLAGVSEIVKRYSATPEGTSVIINYMVWRLLVGFFPTRLPEEAQRKEQCLKETEEIFGPAITSMYVQAKNVQKSEEVVEQVNMMVDTMKLAFKSNLPRLSWMSARSLKAAEAKLHHMVDLIGYPKYVLNQTWLDATYDEIEITDDYMMNLVSHRSFARKRELKDFYEDFRRGRWNDFTHLANIATVDAYYNQASNTMIVPIGMLQPPLFWTRPKSLTFGAFGIVVAHEITHAFDDIGILYDQFGGFKPLYDNKTIEAFHRESDCIRNQYGNFTIDSLKVDGNLTLGENIADHGGLKIAEIAYHEWLKTNSDSRLPAVDFTDEQLFYLGYALPWCAVHTKLDLKTHVFRDEHSPDRFRVIGPLTNSRDFASAWNCPVGSKMNPKEKCSIW